ncbi:MAG: cyclase family protein [Immundisolibacterales bacterium]|nr:cyclase family protein [Immundisolibacterales bacterium]
MHVVDLSVPVRDGDGRLGLEVRFETPYRFEDCGWQGSTFSMFCHYATHVDAPNHFIEHGSGIDQAPLAKLMGPAALVELSDHGANAGIGGDTLEDRGRHVVPGDIAILRTGWSDRCWGEPAFWSEGPYLGADGARWLVERGVNAVVYDFSEEEVVRGGAFRGEDCVVHHTLLGEDIYNIEYVHRLPAITAERLAIVALPVKLAGLDGAPARVLAIEGFDIPREFEVTA